MSKVEAIVSSERLSAARRACMTRWGGAAALAVCALGTGCVSAADVREQESVGAQDDNLYVDVSTLWPRREVSVCWRNRDSRREVHDWVQAAVDRTWEFVADVDLVGWGDCGTGRADIQISVGDNLGPSVIGGLGTRMTAMQLNFAPGSPFCGFGHPDETYRSCMEFIAIHEFGHALGFAHEQNRADRPAACTQPRQGSNGTETFGPWDWDSVMNYCNRAYAAHPRLSSVDVSGAQHYYGLGGRFIASVVATMW